MMVVVKAPRCFPQPLEIAGPKDGQRQLDELQRLIDGDIEVLVTHTNPRLPGCTLVLLGDEEGKLKRKLANVVVPGDIAVGTVVVAAMHGMDLVGLTPDQISYAIHWLQELEP